MAQFNKEMICTMAGSIQDELYATTYILEGMEAVLVMMMEVETNQKAVANMLLSCVSSMMSKVEAARQLSTDIRSSIKGDVETDIIDNT